MNEKLKYIMLIDDNPDDNFFHERELKKANLANHIIAKLSGAAALEYLKSNEPCPDLIFLDINMPGMNGWEFLEKYNQLDRAVQCSAIIIMLTTSDNTEDIAKAKTWDIVSDYITKPLTKENAIDISEKYFK